MLKKGFCHKIISYALIAAMAASFVPDNVKQNDPATASAAAGFEEEYKDTLDAYTIPEWFRDAKFGIFIHYGVYSVPAYGDEWYPRLMYLKGKKTNVSQVDIFAYHEKTYGPVSEGEKYGYKMFIPDFAEGLKSFNQNNMAKQWADLFKEAGANYVMPVGIHHDAFAMYDSDVQVTYNTAAQAGMDYAAELKKAVKENGMKFGLSNHFAENDDYFDENNAPAGADIKATKTKPDELYGDGKLNSNEHIRKWYNISMEIINKYHPDMIYYDYGCNYSPYNKLEDANRYKMLAEFYEQAKENNPEGVVCNYKNEGFTPSQAVFDKERSSLAKINPIAFQTDTSVGTRSWGYTKDERFRSAEDCIKALVDVVSKNGNLLLNVGPMADGTIPDEAQNTLRTMGEWLDTYGDAIYSTRPWVTFGEGPTGTSYDSYSFTAKDIRFTRSKDYKKLYALIMGKPSEDTVTITTLNSNDFKQEIGAVKLLNGSGREELQFGQYEHGLEIYLPDDYAERLTGPFAVEITAADGSMVTTVQVSAADDFQTNNYADADGVTVEACPNDGTDMIVSKKDAEAYAVYNIDCSDSVPSSFTGSFSGDSDGTVEFRVGGRNGKKVGEITLTPSEDGEYHTEKTGLDMRTVKDSDIKLTAVLKGDIKFSSFKLIARNPGKVIEAESYDEKNGSFSVETTKDSEGGTENIGSVTAGAWAKYTDVNFAYGVKELAVRYAAQNNAALELTIDSADGPVIATANVDSTGSWNDYATAAFDINTVDGKKVTGLHDVYVKFKSTLNLNWFKFEACDPVNPTGMSLVNDKGVVEEGQTCWIDMDFEPYDASERQLEYVSDNEKVAIVSEYGEITGVAPGTAAIRITSKAVPSLKAEFTITVTKKPEKPVETPSVTSNPGAANPGTGDNPNTYAATAGVTTKVKNYLGKKITLKKGKKFTIQAAVTPAAAKQGVTYRTSKASVATVSDKGVVTAKKAGSAAITVTSADGTKSAVYKVTVVNKEKTNKTLKLTKNKLNLKKGAGSQIAYKKITPGTTSTFKFKSSRKGVAAVDSYGVIKAKKKGNAVITVFCGKKTAKIKVTVK